MSSTHNNPFKKYTRKFIQLSRNVALLLHIFEKDFDHSWEDVHLQDFEGVYEADYNIHREAAKQFIQQLEGHWCIMFLEALRDECDKIIEEDKKRCEEIEKKYENSKRI